MTDYGTDTYCLDSMKTGRMVSGATLIGQRFYHALITPRGALLGGPDEESFGEDFEELVGAPAGKESERAIRNKVQRAASKDDEILSVSVNIQTTTETNGAVSHEVSITAQTAKGPFDLVLSINDLEVSLVGLS